MATVELPLAVIVGETASGKSALAMELARKFDGEIICADSWTVRREVNIGTAKPSTSDRKAIRHHLLDVVGPDEDFTAAVFKNLANQAISDITNRGKLPIMVGGTGLYIDGVLYDYSFLATGDRQAREALNVMSLEKLIKMANERGVSLEGVDTRNKRRIIRAIETGGEQPKKSKIRENTLVIGLKITPKELRKRVQQRVQKMIEAGLEHEASQLFEKYGPDCEALKGIGYKEWLPYFDGKLSHDEVTAQIVKNTLALAKRQRTWFKRNKSIQWVNNRGEAVEIMTTFLNNLASNQQ